MTYNISPYIVRSGLEVRDFYNATSKISFNSSKTSSHNTPAPSGSVFSTLDGLPHNSTHNYIGGVGLRYGCR